MNTTTHTSLSCLGPSSGENTSIISSTFSCERHRSSLSSLEKAIDNSQLPYPFVAANWSLFYLVYLEAEKLDTAAIMNLTLNKKSSGYRTPQLPFFKYLGCESEPQMLPCNFPTTVIVNLTHRCVRLAWIVLWKGRENFLIATRSPHSPYSAVLNHVL